ncbi:MAG: NADH-quinone oxidoreductase subunit NuoE [Pseudomonadota bacterium]
MTDSGQVFHISSKKVAPVTKKVVLSDAAEKRAREIIPQYPQSRSAIMPLLYIAQDELGYISQEAVEWVAEKLSMPAVQVWEVATFYTMYYKKPVGKYHFQVCRTLPCALRGAKMVSEYLHKKFGLQPGEVSADGLWSFEEVECLGSCGTAPMCQINDVFFENLTEAKLDTIIERIGKERPDLRFSTVRDELGAGLSGCPKSEIR